MSMRTFASEISIDPIHPERLSLGSLGREGRGLFNRFDRDRQYWAR